MASPAEHTKIRICHIGTVLKICAIKTLKRIDTFIRFFRFVRKFHIHAIGAIVTVGHISTIYRLAAVKTLKKIFAVVDKISE